MNIEEYIPIGVEKITLNNDTVQGLTPPPLCSAATVSCYGGFALYSVYEPEPPDSNFGRPLPDGEEVVLITDTWLNGFRIRRSGADTLYIYITYYKNG